MSFRTRRELLIQIIPRYREAGRNLKKTSLMNLLHLPVIQGNMPSGCYPRKSLLSQK